MPAAFKKLSGNYDLFFLLLFALTAVFYSFNLGFSDLWSDEIYTKSMTEGSVAEMVAKYRNDLHPPLYYIGLKLFTSVFGAGALPMRVFSVLGVLSTLLLGYFAGQRIFGKQGAFYFCLMIVSIPMLASYSQIARMYTWAAFVVTGVFIFSARYLQSGGNRNLAYLFLFTAMAMFLHYYSLAAAFVANVFVFFWLLFTGNKNWRRHLLAMGLAVLLFLPWLSLFMVQIQKVQHAFWAPEVSFSTLLSCFTTPFTEQYWTTWFSKVLTIVMYVLLAVTIFLSFTKRFKEYRLVFWLSLTVFLGTLLVATVVSLVSQPILYSRYVMAIVVMLAVPPALLLKTMRSVWLKTLIIAAIVVLGVRVSYSTLYFSYGPYRQTIEYISSIYPNISKVLHITEITAAPMLEYTGNSGLVHCWLKAEMSNVDAFPEIRQYNQPGEFLQKGEEFCAVQFHNNELNKVNLDRVLAESELIRIDTIADQKMKNGIFFQLYLLKYRGNNPE